MAIQFTLALVVSSLCLLAALESVVQTKRVADSAEADRLASDVHLAARAKRHAPPSRAFLIAPPSARKMEADSAVPRSAPSADEFPLQGREYENQEGPGPADASQPTSDAAPTGSDAAPTTAAPEGSDEGISPLIVYAIVAGLLLAIVATLVVAIAVVYIVCTIAACDQDDKDDEEDACAAPKGKPSGSARRRPASAPLSRCPSFSRHSAGDRRYTQQSVDLGRQSSRGSSLGRQSSCRICPRFAPKSSRARASSGTCSSGAGDGPVAPGTAPAPSANDCFVSCVCDLPTPREYSPSVSAASTFGRC